MKRRLESIWAKGGHIQVSDLSNDFFLVRFSDGDDYYRVAFQGPWKTIVNRIGNHIGRTVRMDLATSEGARARYARVCVEIDISKPLLGKYMIGDRVLFVEYESLENICFHCGMYGHKEASCPILLPAEKCVVQPVTPPPASPVNESEKEAGSWMIVNRRQKKKAVNAPARMI
ncbi:hypothetical protein LINPERPRIM_LOCUS2738 [Linum perenne]